MKNTLLALMLVSSLFVISCGADATKPGDLQAKSYESKTGTASYTAQVNGAVDANTICMNLGITGDTNSVKITKIVSIKSQDAATGQYTTDIAFTETKNIAGDIVLSVTPAVTGPTYTSVEIAYEYRVDTVPSSQGKVDVSRIKPTLEAEVVYSSTTHSAGIKIDNAALSAGKKAIYKLYLGETEHEYTPEIIATDGSITLNTASLGGLQNNDKIFYKIWVY